jgi:hypothetical protein
MLNNYGEMARPPVAVRPHMLRHACGFAPADQAADTRLIQDYLVHRSIQNKCAISLPILRSSRNCGDNVYAPKPARVLTKRQCG